MIYIHRDFSVVYGFEQNSNLRHITWHITFTKPHLRIYQGMILKTTCSLLQYPPTLHSFEDHRKHSTRDKVGEKAKVREFGLKFVSNLSDNKSNVLWCINGCLHLPSSGSDSSSFSSLSALLCDRDKEIQFWIDIFPHSVFKNLTKPALRLCQLAFKIRAHSLPTFYRVKQPGVRYGFFS